jgi:antitoxin (DNA-binding transcriptional repressor) of toxin-antitoxin stability system
VEALTPWTNRTNLIVVKRVNVHAAKTQFSRLLAEVEETGGAFVICRNGEAIADLVPHKRTSRIKPHPVLRKINTAYDPTEPLSDDEWPEGER